MLDTLTATMVPVTGTTTVYPIADAALNIVEKRAKKKGTPTKFKANTKQSSLATSISATVTTGATTAITETHYDKMLDNTFAYVESMSDEELEAALIAIGDLEAEVVIEEPTKSI